MAKKEVDHFHANLRALCSGYGAVTALAQYLEIHRVTMSKIVNGHEDVTMEQAQSIAQYFSMDLSDMLVTPSKFRKTSAAS